MLEHEAMAWLRQNDIPVPEFRFVSDAQEAIHGCKELGYPVAMKVVSPEILHKSDEGGVILNIGDDKAALGAFSRLQEIAAGRAFRGVVIYAMIRDAQEVLLGLTLDPQFGPVVAFGLGGIYTEVWRDVSLRVAPIDRDQAAEEEPHQKARLKTGKSDIVDERQHPVGKHHQDQAGSPCCQHATDIAPNKALAVPAA